MPKVAKKESIFNKLPSLDFIYNQLGVTWKNKKRTHVESYWFVCEALPFAIASWYKLEKKQIVIHYGYRT